MPNRAIREIKESNGSIAGMKIGILGVTYRPGVKESAFSGALDLLRLLKSEEVQVSGLDPFYDESELKGLGFSSETNLADVDGIIIHTAHPEFTSINFNEISNLKFIYDGRRLILNHKNATGYRYLSY
jgi:UDP-N-acetyl-D-mannosaminuronate dehydrogenase